ncbi:MAG: hypothetical protein ABSE72_07860 [Bacteroidales bacterium]
MIIIKISLNFLLCFVMTTCISGQTLIGIKAGLNLSGFRNTYNESDYSGTYKSFPSYSFGIEIKGRKLKVIHFGGSVEYYRNYTNWQAFYGPMGGPMGQNINYNIEWLRFSIFPELAFGNKVKFIFNLSPYVSIRVLSSMKGTSWIYSQSKTITENETGSAKDNITQLDIGFKENIGLGYSVLPFLVLSLEENGSLGILPVNKTTDGTVKTKDICFFLCVSYIIPGNKSKEKK